MEDSKLKKVYDTIVKEGYDVPDFATFETDMRDDKKLTQVRDRLVEDGYELPEFGQFKIDMFGAPQETAPQQESKATDAATKGGENGYTFSAEELGIDERNGDVARRTMWGEESIASPRLPEVKPINVHLTDRQLKELRDMPEPERNKALEDGSFLTDKHKKAREEFDAKLSPANKMAMKGNSISHLGAPVIPKEFKYDYDFKKEFGYFPGGSDTEFWNFLKTKTGEDYQMKMFGRPLSDYEIAKLSEDARRLGFWGSVGQNFKDMGYNLKGVELELAEGIADLFGVEHAQKNINKEREEILTAKENFKPTAEGFGGFVAEMIPQMVGTGAGILVSTVNPALGGALITGSTATQIASSMGSQALEARQAGAGDAQTAIAMLLNGGIELLTEKYVNTKYLKRVMPSLGEVAAEASEEALSEEFSDLLTAARKKFGNKITAKNAGEFVKDVLEEGGSEFAAETLQSLVPMIYENKEDYPTIVQVFENGWEGAKGGFFIGGILGGASTAVQRRANNKRRAAQGFVDVAEVEFAEKNGNKKTEIVEIVGKNDKGELVAFKDGESVIIAEKDIKDRKKYNYNFFRSAELEAVREEAASNTIPEEVNGNTVVAADKAVKDAEAEVRRLLALSEDADVDAVINGRSVEEVALGDEKVADALNTYLEEKAKYEGMQDKMQDTREGEYIEVDKSVDAVAHEDGNVYRTALPETGETIFITGGKVVLDSEGYIDVNQSEGLVALMPNGKKEAIKAGNVRDKVIVENAQEQKNVKRAEIDARYKQQLNTFTYTDKADGTEHTVRLVSRGEQMARVILDGVEQDVPNNVFDEIVAEETAENGEVAQAMPAVEGENAAPVEQPELSNAEQLPKEKQVPAPIPIEKRGKEEREAYHLVPIERTMEDLHDGTLEPDEIEGLIDARIKEAESDVKAVEKKKPVIGADKNAYVAAKQQWQADMEAAKAKFDYYNQLKAINAEVTRSEMREAVDAVKPRDIVEKTADEFVASVMPKITPESFKKETGLKNSEQKALVGVIAGEDNGGVTIEQAAEIVLENYEDELRGLGFNGDVQDVRDMIIDILSTGNPRSYAKKGAEMRAQESVEEQLAQLESIAVGMNFKDTKEMIGYEEAVVPRIIQDYTGFDETEYFNNLAENIEYDTTRESEGTRGSSELLQGEQSVDNAGVADIAGPGQGSEVQGNVYSGGENAAPQGNQQVNSSEFPNSSTVSQVGGQVAESGNALGKSGVAIPQATNEMQPVQETIDQTAVEVAQETQNMEPVAEKVETEPVNAQESVKPRANVNTHSVIKSENEKKALRKRTEKWTKKLGVKVNVLESYDEVTDEQAKEAILEQRTPGWFSNGEVYIYMPHLINEADLDRTIVHEGVAHKGIKQMLGEEFNKFLDNVWNAMSVPAKAKYLSYVKAKKNATQADRRAAADEYVAALAEKVYKKQGLTAEEKTIWQKFADWFRKKFNVDEVKAEVLAKETLTDEDIAKMIRASYETLQSNKVDNEVASVDGETRFSKKEAVTANTNTDNLPTTRKEALNSIEQLRQRAMAENEDGLPYFVNEETGNKFFVSNGDVRHTMMYHNIDQIKVVGVYDKIIKKAHFVENLEVDETEKDTTKEISKYVCPVIIDGRPYIADMTAKKYGVGQYTLDEVHLYDTKLKDDDSAPSSSTEIGIPDFNSQSSSSDANVINNFENPNIESENSSAEQGNGTKFRKVFHGSGAQFDKFDHSFMGTGEGAQAYGWGTYVTEVEDIGRTYAGVGVTKLGLLQAKLGNIDSAISLLEKEVQRAEKDLTSDNETARRIAAYTLETASERRKALEEEKAAVEEEIKSYRNLYTVEIPDDNGSNYLHWEDVVPSNVVNAVKQRLFDELAKGDYKGVEKELKRELDDVFKYSDNEGYSLYGNISAYLGGGKAASQFLNDMGFVGISYPANATTGGRADGLRNYVIFNEDDAVIEDRTMFRRANKNQDIFVSNALRAVEGKTGSGNAVEVRNPKTEEQAAQETTGGLTEEITERTLFRKAEQIGEDEVVLAENAVTALGEKLNIPARVVNDVESLPENKRDKKGWVENGEVVVVMDNHVSMEDAMQTVLHEVVGRKGLRAVMGEEFDALLDVVYRNLPKNVQSRINNAVMTRFITRRQAVEEYLAELAGKGDVMDDVKQWMRDYFRNEMNLEVEDGELQYMLWKNSQRLQTPTVVSMVQDSVMEAETNTGDNGTRFRTANDTAKDVYEKNVRGRWNKVKEGHYDRLRSVRKAQEAIADETGMPISDSEDVYSYAEHLPSINKIMKEQFDNKFLTPFIKLLKRIYDVEFNGKKLDEKSVERYTNAKHGLERNRDMAVANALTTVEEVDGKKKPVFNKDAYEDWQTKKAAILAENITWEEKQDKLDELAKTYGAKLKDYSGLTAIFDPEGKMKYKQLRDEAIKYVTEMEGAIGKKSIDELWKIVKGMTDFSLKQSYESGLLSKDMYESISKRYEFYVPLRGFTEETAEDYYDYLAADHTPLNSVIKRAEGRKSEADNIFATILNMANSAIVFGNKNRLKQRVLNLATRHKSSLLSADRAWYEKKGEDVWELALPVTNENMTEEQLAQAYADFEADMKRKEALGEARRQVEGLNIKTRVISDQNKAQHAIRVKRNGREYIVWVNASPTMANAVNGMLREEETGWALNAIDAVNKFRSKMVTQFSPTFVLTNLFRDVQGASTVYGVRYGAKALGQFEMNVMGNSVKMMGLYAKFKKGTLDENVPLERYFKEFLENGGETGYTEMISIEEYNKALNKLTEKLNIKNATGRALEAAGEGIEFANRCVENLCRFSAYMTSRENGISILQSVNDAKEVSVNFNRKGSGAMGAGVAKRLFMFYNPAVQALVQRYLLAKNYPKRMIPVLAGEFALGAMQPILFATISALASSAFGDDDETWEEKFNRAMGRYYNLTDFRRRGSICLPLGDGVFNPPLAHESRVFFGLGELAMSLYNGHETYDNTLAQAMDIIGQALPLNPVEGWVQTGNLTESLLLNLTPDALKPFAENAVNRDFAGNKIHNASDMNAYLPEYMRGKKSTAEIYNRISKLLSGGESGFERGFLDDNASQLVNPSKLEHLVEGYLGGAYTFAEKLVRSVSWAMGNEENADVRNIPFVSSFYTPIGKYEENPSAERTRRDWERAFDYYQGEIKLLDGKEKSAKRGLKFDMENAAETLEAMQGGEALMVDVFNDGNKILKELYADVDAARTAKDFDKVKEIDQEIYAQKRFITERMEQMVENPAIGYTFNTNKSDDEYGRRETYGDVRDMNVINEFQRELKPLFEAYVEELKTLGEIEQLALYQKNEKMVLLYNTLKRKEQFVSNNKKAMENNPEKADEYMDNIRRFRAEAIDLINNYNE